MKNVRTLLFIVGFVSGTLALCGHIRAVEPELPREFPAWAEAFKAAGVEGTFVVLDAQTGISSVHNAKRAAIRYIPASTFKIPNTLLGLETGAVSSVDEVLPFGGGPQFMPSWERDMSLREAIKISNVPIYRELARRIGLERMRLELKKLNYGNGEIGEVVDRFWLDGPLAISAMEQTDFLSRLAADNLPCEKANMAAVREMTLLEKTDTLELHGKTGWCSVVTPGIGWFVGWVERGGKRYCFALNMDTAGEQDLGKRIPLAKECLRLFGVY